MASQSPFSLIPKLAALWIALLVLPLIERTLLGARTYYGLFIGLGLVFVLYGLTIRSIFAFLQRTRRQPFYVWIMFLVWSLFICCVLAGFAIGYDLLPHTPEPSLTKSRPLIDYLYYEIMTFTTEVLQLCSHAVIVWLDAPFGLFGLQSIQMASI